LLQVLIVEDEKNIVDILRFNLERKGYRTLEAYDGEEGLRKARTEKPDLILLDLMLPGQTGEEILPKIKNIPVIVMSAKTDVKDKVDLLLGGAADYVTKPFDTKELLARITVQLRNASLCSSSLLTYDDLELDTSAHSVRICEKTVKLTRTEYAILKLLMQNPTQVIAKSVILDRISQDTPDCTESSLKVHMSHLRKKLMDVGEKDYIESVWGIGFKMNFTVS